MRTKLNAVELAGFIAGPLTRAISELGPSCLLGPWPVTRPAGRRVAEPGARPFVPPHADDFLEVCLVLRGECVLCCGADFYAAEAGTLGVYPPGMAHGAHCRRAGTSYEVAFWMLRPVDLVMGYNGYTPQAGHAYFGRAQVQSPGQDIRNAGRRLLQFAAEAEPPPVVAVKESLLTWTLGLLRNVLARPDKDGSETRQAVVRDAKAYVEPRLTRALSVAEVAHSVMLSPNYLTTAFRMETGLSLGNYIKRRRIDRAKELLATTGRSVKDIAMALGFADPYTFSRTFKTVEGLSPARYRDRV